MRRFPSFSIAGLLFLSAACGDDDGAGGLAASLPPGATVPPGDLPPAAAYVELEGTAVGVSQGFACALTLDKKVVCWGAVKYQHLLQLNALGKTGLEIRMPSPPTSISMGGDGACATTEGGDLRCWGGSIRGNTGAGKIGSPEVGETVSIAGFTGKVDHVHLGESNGRTTCAISNGKPYCWDLGRDDAAKELEGGVTDAKLVAGANDMQCVVRADDKLYCWGSNEHSQLGIPIGGTGTSAPPKVTTPTEVPDLGEVTAVEIDSRQVCAVAKGEVLCWGSRWYAGMDAAERTAAVPKYKVKGLTNVVKLRRASGYFCATTSDNAAYCWASSSTDAPTALKLEEPGATDIALDTVTRCGVFAENRVKCWGSAAAIVGDGGFAYHPIPTFVPGIAGATKLFADAGGACALTKDNQAWCWGNATTRPRNVPTATPDEIGDGHAQRWPALDNASFLTTTGDLYQLSRCGVFDGAIKCASRPSETAASPLNELTNVADFAMGGDQSCARLTDGTLSCWFTKTNKPVPVTGVTGVKAVVMVVPRAGGAYPCILQEGSGVRCLNGIPASGSPATFVPTMPDDELAPAQSLVGGGATWCGLVPNGVACDVDPLGVTEIRGEISGSNGASLLAVGIQHGCAVIGGRVQCWGRGESGQLGSGNLTISAAAFPVSNAAVPTAMSAGNAFTCSLLSDGRVQCWGSNATGMVSPPPMAHERPNQVRVIY